MSRPVFSFRPKMGNEEHKRAWDILSAVPEGNKNQFLVQAILHEKETEHLTECIREIIREELRNIEIISAKEITEVEEIPADLMDFMTMLQEE